MSAPAVSARYAGETRTLASPTRPITPTSSAPATSTASQSPVLGSAGSRAATEVRTTASAAVGIAAARANTGTRRSGASASTTVANAGTAIAAAAISSRLVTQCPQRGAVCRSELGEDPLVEDDGHEGDEDQVEGDPELDRCGRAPRHLERRKRDRVLDQDDADDLEERRVAQRRRRDAEREQGEHASLGVARGQAEGRHEPRQHQREGNRDS